MEYEEYIRQGLEGGAPLKIIMSGSVENTDDGNTGVVGVVYATENKALAKLKLQELKEAHPENYYMVYSVPLDMDLTTLGHYPSIEISREDLE